VSIADYFVILVALKSWNEARCSNM